MCVRDFVQVKERLVDGSLQLLSCHHAIEGTPPLVLGRPLDVLEDNAPTSLVLEVHQLLGMPKLFQRRLLEELGQTWQANIVPVVVVRLQEQKIRK